MHAHDQLAGVVALALQALVHEVILGRHVEPLEVDVLLKLLQDDLLLRELLVQVPYVKPVLLRNEEDLGLVLHAHEPGESRRSVVLAVLLFFKADHITLNGFFDDVGLHEIDTVVSTDLNRAHKYNRDPIIQEDRLIFAKELDF